MFIGRNTSASTAIRGRKSGFSIPSPKIPPAGPSSRSSSATTFPRSSATAKLLQQYPVAAIDLNLGCPAPIVYRKCAGGGLLREPGKIDAILGALRDAVTIPFTVKTRIGFKSPAEFDALLPLFAKHPIDLLTVHARTVTQMYRPGVRYDLIARAARELRCPVLPTAMSTARRRRSNCWPRPARAA
jgi:tRNA-dihydrouridine synthase B